MNSSNANLMSFQVTFISLIKSLSTIISLLHFTYNTLLLISRYPEKLSNFSKLNTKIYYMLREAIAKLVVKLAKD
uniref:Uncharacterized protein n=1 Tax=Glossina brevipalpis TaxID=37001 RepID=A0A1A9W0D2_9MUSC